MKVPTFKDPDVTKFLVQQDIERQRLDNAKMDSNSGNRALLLYSPNKTVFQVTVDDSGVLHVARATT